MATSAINFTRGMPPVETFPTEALIRAAESALRNDPAVLLQYGRSPGYMPLRELLGGWYGVGPDQVLVGNSSLEIVDFIARTKLGPGKRAFVESPSYDRTITTFRRVGAEVVGIPLLEDGVDLEAMERALKAGPPPTSSTPSPISRTRWGSRRRWPSDNRSRPGRSNTGSGWLRTRPTGVCATGVKMCPPSTRSPRSACSTSARFPRRWRPACGWAMPWRRPGHRRAGGLCRGYLYRSCVSQPGHRLRILPGWAAGAEHRRSQGAFTRLACRPPIRPWNAICRRRPGAIRRAASMSA